MKHLSAEQLLTIPGPAGAIEALLADLGLGATWMILCHPHPLYQGSMHHKILSTTVKVAHAFGINTLRFNYRGVGESEGSYGEVFGELDDAKAIHQWLKTQHRPEKIWYFGFSFGAYVALHTAYHMQDAEGTLLVAPSISNMPYDVITTLPKPLWVLQGDADEVIDYPAVNTWVAKHHLEASYQVFSGVGHFFHGQQHLLSEAITSILKDQGDG